MAKVHDWLFQIIDQSRADAHPWADDVAGWERQGWEVFSVEIAAGPVVKVVFRKPVKKKRVTK